MRAMLALSASAILATSCVAAGGEAGGSMRLSSCSLAGEDFAGGSRETICAIFAEALAATDSGSEPRSLALEAFDSHLAKARILRADGGEVLALEFAITDAPLSEAAWRKFAADVARHYARTAAQ